MWQLAAVALATLMLIGAALAPGVAAQPNAQLPSPTALLGPAAGQTLLPLRTPTTMVPLRPNVALTAAAAAATITAADATSTAIAAVSQNVAQTATALARATAVVTPSATVTRALTATAVPTTTPTVAPTLSPTAPPTATPTPTATPDPLALGRTVLTLAAIAVGEQTIQPGAPLVIPLDVELIEDAIPPGTPVRLPDGRVVTLPLATSVPAAESPTLVGAPLNATLARLEVLGDQAYPAGTRVGVPSGASVLGTVVPGGTVLIPAGGVVQVEGRTTPLAEALQVTVSGELIAAPARLPPTGDAALEVWPAAVGILVLLIGWRLLRPA